MKRYDGGVVYRYESVIKGIFKIFLIVFMNLNNHNFDMSLTLRSEPAPRSIKANIHKRSPTVCLISTVRGERLQPIANAF